MEALNIFADEKKQDLSYFPINEIYPAPENVFLYDSFAPNENEDDRALYFSIKDEGIREPLQISFDHIILSGHRRYAAASWLGLRMIPCMISDDVSYRELSADERMSLLAIYNKQRDKSYTERLREAMLDISPDAAYERLLEDRVKRQQVDVEGNVQLGDRKARARITTRAFLQAAQRVLQIERDFWPLTVRRVHYLLLNDPPLRHDKKPASTYKNDLASYKSLTNLLLRARLTGDIPQEAIEDETRPIRVVITYQSPSEYIKREAEDFLQYYARDLLRGQTNHIEILVEKNAIRKHVERVADEYCIPCTTGRGYSSLTPRWKMVSRFVNSGKGKLILLVLSDFDPDGEEIAASFPRSLRDDFGLENIIVHKVALTGDDVRDNNLPSDMEAKVSSKNYKKFVARHGIHVAELDAAPVSLLQSKLRNAIEGCLDMETFQAERAAERQDSGFIQATRKLVLKALKY